MKIFISHSWSASSLYYELKSLLSENILLKYEDLSVPNDSPLLLEMSIEGARRREIELQEDRLIQIDQQILLKEDEARAGIAELDRIVERELRAYRQSLRTSEDQLERAKTVKSKILSRLQKCKWGIGWLKQNEKLLHKFKMQGRDFLVADQEAHVHELSEKYNSKKIDKWHVRLDRVTRLEQKYHETVKLKKQELESQRRRANSQEIESSKEGIRLALSEAKTALKRERQHVANLLVKLGTNPANNYSPHIKRDHLGIGASADRQLARFSPELALTLRQRIASSDVVFVIVSPFCTWRAWVNFELSIASHYHIPIIPIAKELPAKGLEFDLRILTEWRTVPLKGQAIENAIQKLNRHFS